MAGFSAREATKRAPLEFIESDPPVFVSEYATDGFPSLSSFTTALLSFWAIRRPPSLVPTMPSATLPDADQIVFHRCPAAITPGISVTVYSLGPCCAGGAAGAGAPPRACPPACP